MDWTLEVITVPVTDVDRSLAFYRDKAGFHVDLDMEVMPGARVVQLTPPGSGCSIALTDGVPSPTGQARPGGYHGLQLVVTDIEAARAELTGRGLEVTGPERYGDSDGATFLYFTDPDGNGWAVQEYRARIAEPLHELLARQRDTA